MSEILLELAPEQPQPPPPPLQGSRFRRASWLPRDAAVGVALALLMAGAVFASSEGMFERVPYPVLILLGGVMEFGIMLAFPLWLLRRRTDPAHLGPKPPRHLVKEFLLAIPSTIGVLFCTGIVIYAAQLVLIRLGRPAESSLEFWGQKSEHSLVPLVILATAVAPVVEETFFRGFLYNALRSVLPVWVAAVVQAFLFGAGHIYEPLGVIGAFVIGFVLAMVYEWRKTLLAPMFVHAMYNSITMVVIASAILANAKAPIIGVGFARDATDRAVVNEVVPGSPAEQADIRPGDVIVKYDGHEVADGKQLIQLVRAGKVGDKVSVEIVRGDRHIKLHLILRARSDVD
jgi:membrane protease YdiL (CAAX protease family)